MKYFIQKPSRIDENIIVYYAGGSRWTDDESQKACFATKKDADSIMENIDGTNGGWVGATVVSE